VVKAVGCGALFYFDGSLAKFDPEVILVWQEEIVIEAGWLGDWRLVFLEVIVQNTLGSLTFVEPAHFNS
jgi:hypothetical protein